MAPRVLVVSGASRPDSNVHAVVHRVLNVLDETAADVRLLDLSRVRLPVMEYGNADQAEQAEVVRVRSDADWAQGFVIVTPEYHGNMSGALKNWFDFLWPELAGKFAGVMSVTGGGGGDMSITAVKNCFSWCHGFTLPFHAAARSDDFDGGALRSTDVLERIDRIAHDVVRYAPVIHGAFEKARDLGPEVASGVAGTHAEPEEEP